MFYKKGFPKNFAKFTGKYLCRYLYWGASELQYKTNREEFSMFKNVLTYESKFVGMTLKNTATKAQYQTIFW